MENTDVLIERLARNIRMKCYREGMGQTNRSSELMGHMKVLTVKIVIKESVVRPTEIYFI